MPSGKQILLELLRAYSQVGVDDDGAHEASERLRAGLLLHGSTATEAWSRAEKVAWLVDPTGRDGGVQGLGLVKHNLLLADLFELILEDESILERLKARVPNFDEDDYDVATDVIWLLLTQLQFFEELASVEAAGRLERDAMESLLAKYREKMARFRSDPDDFLGTK